MRRLSILLLLLICGPIMYAGVPIVRPDLSEKTLVAPGYFGPNAFQVPEMNNGTVYDRFHVGVAGDYFRELYTCCPREACKYLSYS